MHETLPTFTMYMHDQVESFEMEEIYEDVPWDKFTDKAKENFGPGYEVPIECVVDPETGETWAIGLKVGDRIVPLAEKVPV